MTAEFAFLAFYQDYPSERMAVNLDNDVHDYSKLPKRQRGASMCAGTGTTLSPVMEEDVQAQQDAQKKAKRRFSLDFLFAKKKRHFKVNENAKRGSTDSTSSNCNSIGEEGQTDTQAPNPAEIRRNSIKASKAEIAAWVFA